MLSGVTSLAQIVLLLVAVAAVGLLVVNLVRGLRQAEHEQGRLLSAAGAEPEGGELRPPGRLAQWLRAAGLGLSPAAFVLVALAVGLLVLLLLLSRLPSIPWAGALLAVLAVFLCHVLLQEWGELRVRRFERRLVDAVDHMVSALVAGENLVQALASAAGTSPGPVGRELDRLVSRLRAGQEIRPALAPLAERYDCEGVRLLTQVLAVKWQAGGELAPVMRSVAWVMRQRIRLRMRLWTELGAFQLVGLAIAAVPYVLIPLLVELRPQWTETLVSHPLGQPLLAAAIALQFVGILWLRQNARIEL